MKFVIILSLGLAAVAALPYTDSDLKEWNQYKKAFDKHYPNREEDELRMSQFLKKKLEVEEHNEKYERGETSYKMAINQFSDKLPKEIQGLRGFKAPPDESRYRNGEMFTPPAGVTVPDYVNWVERGAVTSVKYQGLCGSCYAFSAVGALEGLLFISNKTVTDLSPQNLLDCSRDYGNLGCDGGWPNQCFEYVRDAKGINTEKAYPYEGREKKCRFNPKAIGGTCHGFVDIQAGNETALKIAVASRPVAVGVASKGLESYGSGIYERENCFEVDHAMVVVGYGTDKKTGKDYWLLKNSWSKAWGEKGYVRFRRNAKNMCGIASYASYPILR